MTLDESCVAWSVDEYGNWLLKIPKLIFFKRFGKLPDPQVDGRCVIHDYLTDVWPSQIERFAVKRVGEMFWITVEERKCVQVNELGGQQ